MKKLLCALLALMLTLIPLGAMAAVGDANLGTDLSETYDDSVSCAFTVGDTLYLCGHSHIFSYHIGDADLAAIEYELPYDGESAGASLVRMFAAGDKVYAILYTYDAEEYSVQGVELREVTLGDAVTFGDPVALSMDDFTNEYDGQRYINQIDSVCAVGERAFLLGYGSDGNESLYALNLADGTGSYLELDGEKYPVSVAAWTDGTLLIQFYDYYNSERTFEFYDPESETFTPACDPAEEAEQLANVAVSAETGKLFYLDGGYVMAAEDFDFENAQAVAELSVGTYGAMDVLLMPGDYYVYCGYEVIAVRNTDPDALPETRLTVRNMGYSDAVTKAYYDFTNAHSDVALVLNTDYQQDSQIIEDMMNRDSSTDVYILQAEYQAYSALFSRGYMAELDSEKIRAAVEEMYPAVQAVLERDGQIVAVPVSTSGYMMGLDLEGFEKLGIAEADIPTDWAGFLDFLQTLPDKLPEDGSVLIFDSYETARDLRWSLLGQILLSWQAEIDAGQRETGYTDAELQEAVEKLMAIDFVALGAMADDAQEDDGVTYYYTGSSSDTTHTLVQTGVGCTPGNFYSATTPWALSFEEGQKGLWQIELYVAFVNPFSEHVDLAQEFLEALVDNMENSTSYTVNPSLTEGVRSSYYEDNKATIEKEIERIQTALETAEPVDKPALEEDLASAQESLTWNEENNWDISPESIEWYRANAEKMIVKQYSFFNADNSDTQEVSDSMQQMLDGRIEPAAFLKVLDQKARMQALEGN